MAINFNNRFVTFNNGNRNTNRPMDQKPGTFGDTLTWTVGKHNLKWERTSYATTQLTDLH